MIDDAIIFVYLLSILMLLFINWVYFFDWMQLIGGIAHLLYPNKVIKEIEDARILRKNDALKKHLRKWKVRFLLVPISFTVVFWAFSALTAKVLISYFLGLIFVVVAYGVMSKREAAERENVIKGIIKSAQRTEDGLL